MDIALTIANELAVKPSQVAAAIALLDEGATVPFVARYRKEATGGLDDTHLRQLDERLGYLREMEERRATVLSTIEKQGKLTDELKAAILEADSKTRLEDLYAPYRPKRRTKAQMAREAGIEPLVDSLLANPAQDPAAAAAAFLAHDQGYGDADAVLEGARHIFMERVAEDADLVGRVRQTVWDTGRLRAVVVEEKREEGRKFSDYFEHDEPLKDAPSHRALALFRGRAEGVLRLQMVVPGQDDLEDKQRLGVCEGMIAERFGVRQRQQAADAWLLESVRWSWRVKLSMQMETELFTRLREQAEEEAIRVFGENLRDLLLAAPAGPRSTMGLDPGLRTGVKVAVVDVTGKLVDHTTIFPHAPRNQWAESLAVLEKLAAKHGVQLIAIGNGTASRETDKLAKELIARAPKLGLTSLVVNEAGASVYSASELAAKEFPELDVSFRGAVSIARRLQDPLAELVKIDPKSIGVGQYQHDVNQSRLARKLDAVVEDCVNAVGVDVNTASVPLLARVAGLNSTLATNIVAFRDGNGPFANRSHLLKIPRLGPKAYEQSAGFLRIMSGDNPLDASGVHPESYPVVERIIANTGKNVRELIGDTALLLRLEAKAFVDEKFGEPTVRDILRELEKPGRDPRPEFKTASFREGVEKLEHLEPGMVLEGVVTNVTNFGAFVDVGVHQDGLVHVSALAEKFVKDPRDVVKAGDVVKVKVLEVDRERRRIGLTMRLGDQPGAPAKRDRSVERGAKPAKKHKPRPQREEAKPMTALAEAFARLQK